MIRTAVRAVAVQQNPVSLGRLYGVFMLYHVSESDGIAVFEPRWAEVHDAAVVWAIHERRLHNYLLPRDCPRVAYSANADTSTADIAQYLGAGSAAVAVESRWAQRLQSTKLYCYQLPADAFRVMDVGAGYYISNQSVIPISVREIENPMLALLERGIEIRFMRELVAFSQRIAASTLEFSLIRMRNAGSAA